MKLLLMMFLAAGLIVYAKAFATATLTVNVTDAGDCPCDCGEGGCDQDVCCDTPGPSDTPIATIEDADCNPDLDGATCSLVYTARTSLSACGADLGVLGTYFSNCWAGSVSIPSLGVTINLVLVKCTGPCCDGSEGYQLTGCIEKDGVLCGGIGASTAGGNLVDSCDCDPFELVFSAFRDDPADHCFSCTGKGFFFTVTVTL